MIGMHQLKALAVAMGGCMRRSTVEEPFPPPQRTRTASQKKFSKRIDDKIRELHRARQVMKRGPK